MAAANCGPTGIVTVRSPLAAGRPSVHPVRVADDDELMRSRAVVVHDLAAAGLDSPAAVDVVENAVSGRTWWVRNWPGGAAFVAGQVAQDVQERLLDDTGVRWPRCPSHACAGLPEHSLSVEPELGPDPHWVCESSGAMIAPLGALPPFDPPG